MMQKIIPLFFVFLMTYFVNYNVIGIKVVFKYHLKEYVFLTTVLNIL